MSGNGKVADVETAVLGDQVEQPHDPEKPLLLAYWIGLGATVRRAAEAAGISERTARSWRTCSWWPDVVAEAHSRWLGELRQETKSSLVDLVKMREAPTVRFAAERLIPELAPPKQQVHLEVDLNVKDLRERISDRLRRIAITN